MIIQVLPIQSASPYRLITHHFPCNGGDNSVVEGVNYQSLLRVFRIVSNLIVINGDNSIMRANYEENGVLITIRTDE